MKKKKKKQSAVKKGNFYKRKTKKWFIDQGYDADYLERVMPIGKSIFIKKDLFESDLLAMKENEIIFANSVVGKSNIAVHVSRYRKRIFYKRAKLWIVAWTPGVSEPEIIDVRKYKGSRHEAQKT